MSKISRCLFCKNSSDSSKSVEHIIPESFGSKRLVLPKGAVCDKCNNYFSRKVEGPVLSHQSMRNVRAWHQVPNKKGKFPSVKGKVGGSGLDISMRLDKNGKLDIQPENEKDRAKLDQELKKAHAGEDFAYIFTIDIDPPQKEMSRFLAKMGLEALAYRFLNDESGIDLIIDEPHYDLIRNYARIGSNVKEWPYHRRIIFPIKTQMRHPKTGEWVQAGFGHDLLVTSRRETFFVFVLYGVEFVINLGGPSIKGYEEWLNLNNNISPMIERMGVKLIEKEINKKNEYFLDGSLDAMNGIIFDKERLSNFSD
jgi:hypothetical protein